MSIVYVPQQPMRRKREPDEEPMHLSYGIPQDDFQANDMVPSIDLSAATAFGEIRVVLGRSENFVTSAAAIVRKAREVLAGYGDMDYLIPVGDPLAIATVAAIAAEANQGFIRLLKWEARRDGYFPVNIDLRRKQI